MILTTNMVNMVNRTLRLLGDNLGSETEEAIKTTVELGEGVCKACFRVPSGKCLNIKVSEPNGAYTMELYITLPDEPDSLHNRICICASKFTDSFDPTKYRRSDFTTIVESVDLSADVDSDVIYFVAREHIENLCEIIGDKTQ